MSRWISRYPEFFFHVRDDSIVYDRLPNGETVPRTIRPALAAQFRRANGIDPDSNDLDYDRAHNADIEIAMEHWSKRKRRDGTPGGIGAIPATMSGSIAGRAYRPFDPTSVFGIFDTDWLDDADDAAAVEEKLRDPKRGIGNTHIELVQAAAVAPWPKYDALKAKRGTGNTVADQIRKTIVELGYDPDAVEKYERATLNRADVIKAIGDARDEIATAPGEVDDDDLTTVA